MQHDEKFRPMDTMNTASKTPNEEYFIRKFSSQKPEEPKLTSTILRQEEREFFFQKADKSIGWLLSPRQRFQDHLPRGTTGEIKQQLDY